MKPLLVRNLGRTNLSEVYEAMRRFTEKRNQETPDEIWMTEHHSVYTVGLAGRDQHLPRGASAAAIPIERLDRGGQITYHGHGQAIAYVLLQLAGRSLSVRQLVHSLEQAVIDILASYNLEGTRRPGAPGIYVSGAKVAALGLRVRHGCTYHGLALNIDMDLTPFSAIDPCGYPGLRVTQLRELGVEEDFDRVSESLSRAVATRLRKAR